MSQALYDLLGRLEGKISIWKCWYGKAGSFPRFSAQAGASDPRLSAVKNPNQKTFTSFPPSDADIYSIPGAVVH